MSQTFTAKDVAAHGTVDNGLYIIIDGDVYALADFVDEHPGGAKILKRVGGKDASKQFWKVRKGRGEVTGRRRRCCCCCCCYPCWYMYTYARPCC